MEENEQALSYIENCIRELNTSFRVSSSCQLFTYFVSVLLDDNERTIEFTLSVIDDFQVALEKYKDTSYFVTLESAIKFNIYVDLGSAGFLPEFHVSREIINEKREWVKKYEVDVFFDDEITRILLEGLKHLHAIFDSQLKEHPSLDLSEVEEHKKWVNNLLKYYDKEGTLNSARVGLRNLQYLKAAALSQILDSEEKTRNEKRPTIKRALSKKVYYIVSELRKAPFLEIKLPDFVQDLQAE